MYASRNMQETELVQTFLQRCQSTDRIAPTQNANRARCARPAHASTEGANHLLAHLHGRTVPQRIIFP